MQTAPTLTVETVPIGSIFRDPANVNAHHDDDLAHIAASLSEFGQRTPIVVNRDGMILKGNGTHQAAEGLGWPTIDIVRWLEADETAQCRYAVADNATGKLSDFDHDRLRAYLRGQEGTPGIPEEMRREILARGEIRALPAGEAFNAEQAIAANPDATKVQRGQLFRLGRHYLLCGDCTDAEDVAQLMQGEKATLFLTDPPYGVDLAGKNKQLNESATQAGNGARSEVHLANDKLTGVGLRTLLNDCFINASTVTTPGATIYVCAPQGENLIDFLKAFTDSNWRFKWQLVWVKDNKTFGRSDYHFQHENVLFGWKPDGPHYFAKQGKSSVLQAPKPVRSAEHGSMKPHELIQQLIENSSRPGDNVLDLFAGSGTTLRVCEALGRSCFAMEIEPHFCEVIIALWEADTGLQAELVG